MVDVEEERPDGHDNTAHALPSDPAPATETALFIEDEEDPYSPVRLSKSSPFSYGPNGFTVNGIRRESRRHIRDLISPQHERKEQDKVSKTASKTAKETLNHTWMLAQFRHYGIAHVADTFREDREPLEERVNHVFHNKNYVRRQMKSALDQNQFDAVPTHIVNLKEDLAAKYLSSVETRLQAPEKRQQEEAQRVEERREAQERETREALEREKRQAQEKERMSTFLSLASPVQQVEYDVTLFMRHYFLDADGKYDRDKTPRPLSLPGFQDVDLALANAIRPVLGLAMAAAGQGNSRTVFIGWNCFEIKELAASIDRWQGYQDDATKKMELWRHKAEQYEATKNRILAVTARGDGGFASNAEGVYELRCSTLEHSWPDRTQAMRLHVTRAPGDLFLDRRNGERLFGSFDFGALSGSVVFGEVTPRDGSGGGLYGPQAASAKRLGFDWIPDKTQSRDKRAVLNSSVVSRSPRPPEVDFIDFSDQYCLEFQGVIHLSLYANQAPFRGYKIL